MMYIVGNPDHPERPGMIQMANKVYDHEGYDQQLRDSGYDNFIKIPEAPGLISPEHWHVIKDQLAERPLMDLTLNKDTFKAGDNDAVVVVGAPKNTKFKVCVFGKEVWGGTLPDGELEMSVPTPGTYTIQLECWPYKDMHVVVEAVP